MDDEKQEIVDFAYAIDCTGSMGSYIKAVADDITKVVDSMAAKYPQFKLRLACVGYRDWCDNEKRIETLEFTESVSNFKTFVQNLEADGGGDTAEDVMGGLMASVSLDWASKLRVLYHVLDAPPHNKKYHDGVGDDYPDGHDQDKSHEYVLSKMKEKKIHYCVAKLNSSVTKMISVFKDQAKLIDLAMEEKNISDASEMLDAIKQTLSLLAAMRKEIKQTQQKCNNVGADIQALVVESEKNFQEACEKLDRIDSTLKNIDTEVKQLDTKMEETKRKYDQIKANHALVRQFVREAKTDDEIDAAETKVLEVQSQYIDANTKFSESRNKLNAALSELMKKSKDLDEMSDSSKTTQKKATELKGKTSDLLKNLNNVERSYDRDQLKKDIRAHLKKVTSLFREDAKLNEKVSNARKEILSSFTQLQNRAKDVNEFKREITTKLDEIDNALDELDDRRS